MDNVGVEKDSILERLLLLQLLIVCCCTLVACSAGQQTKKTSLETCASQVEQRYQQQVPGAVDYIWEPPLADVVDIPPGLDPEGHYYRPAHQSIVEIRQGRWEYHQPQDK